MDQKSPGIEAHAPKYTATENTQANKSILPPEKSPWFSNIRYRVYGVYRRLFTTVFVLNLVGFIYVCITQTTLDLRHLEKIAIPIAANVFLAGLFRTDYFINFLYTSVLWVPRSLPLCIRSRLANIYEFGGIHSGAGVASAVWAVLFVVRITQAYFQGVPVGTASVVVTYVLVALLVAICAAAHPSFRRLQHNWFEAIHRFAGWTAIALFWTLTMLLIKNVASVTGQNFAHVLFTSPLIYFLIAITFLTVLPWLRLRLVEAEAFKLSEHAVRMYFSRPAVGIVQGIRISESPLFEWHSFASIPNTLATAKIPASANDRKSSLAIMTSPNNYSILVSAAGDWTREAIQKKRSSRKYWVRGVPVKGVALCALLFRRVVVVTTGTGIGPALSLLAGVADGSTDIEREVAGSSSSSTTAGHNSASFDQGSNSSTLRNPGSRRVPCRLIWSTPNPQTTYGDHLMDEVRTADPEAIVWDSRKDGRPDLVALAWRTVQEFDAEAVVCISNPKVTDMVVHGMRSRGIAAYGPIFDS